MYIHRAHSLAALSALVALALLGCDPVMRVSGVVRAAPPGDEATAPPGATDGHGRASVSVRSDLGALPDAAVVYRCPGAPDVPMGHSDANGRVDDRRVGLMNPECLIVVAHQGYEAQSFVVREVCSVPGSGMWAGGCHMASFVAILRRAR